MDSGPDHVEEPRQVGAERKPEPARIPADTGASGDELEQMEMSIKETEARLAQTLNAIQKKLSPAFIGRHTAIALQEEVVGRIETMTTKKLSEFGENISHNRMETLRNHPGSAALFGLGLGLLLVENIRNRSAQEEKLSKAREMAEQVEEKALSFRSKASQVIEENPLIIGLAGLTAGVIVGVVTSQALRKDFMTETREKIKSRARGILQDTKDKAGQVAKHARRAAKEEAERLNLIH